MTTTEDKMVHNAPGKSLPKVLCLYHADCVDGFTSAWLVSRKLGSDVELREARYGQGELPDVTGRHVLLVDFSFKRDVLEELAKTAKSIFVIDHHTSAEKELQQFVIDSVATGRQYAFDLWNDAGLIVTKRAPIFAVFDNEKSGAQLTFDVLFGPAEKRPLLVDYVGDRDLWKHELPYSREVFAWITSYDFTTENYTTMHDTLEKGGIDQVVVEGAAILRKQRLDVRRQVDLTCRKMYIGGYIVSVANLPRAWDSDGCHMMLEDDCSAPFVASYFDTAEGTKFSLRSNMARGGIDVSEIAKKYGGGGHKQAAGFFLKENESTKPTNVQFDVSDDQSKEK